MSIADIFKRKPKPDDASKQAAKMAVKEGLEFCVLGPSGSGKTTLLACLNDAFQRKIGATITPADPETFALLNDAYESLKAKAEDSNQQFAAAIPGTEEKRDFLFNIKGKNAKLPVRFNDYPGGWMLPSDSHFESVKQMVRQSSVIIVAVKTPYLMEENGKYASEARANDIGWLLDQAFEEDNGREHLILLVPVKCEKYMANDSERERMIAAVKESFATTIALGRSPNYKDRLAIALIPVQTVGNAVFFTFKGARMENNRFTGEEIYMKTKKEFNPQNADQPMRYLMRFLLRLYRLRNASWWDLILSTIFREGDLNDVAQTIADGLLPPEGRDGIRIFSGKQLLDFGPQQKKEKGGILW